MEVKDGAYDIEQRLNSQSNVLILFYNFCKLQVL